MPRGELRIALGLLVAGIAFVIVPAALSGQDAKTTLLSLLSNLGLALILVAVVEIGIWRNYEWRVKNERTWNRLKRQAQAVRTFQAVIDDPLSTETQKREATEARDVASAKLDEMIEEANAERGH